jgi:hypothetical protein
MNIMKTTLWRCQNKEVVSVTINVFVNRAKTHPNGCSFFSIMLMVLATRGKGKKKWRTKGRRMRGTGKIMGCHLSGNTQKEQGKVYGGESFLVFESADVGGRDGS